MHFELLPNELLFNLFEFFNTTDLLRAFLGLNFRLNQLIYNHFRTYRFNFQSISKDNFDIICKEYLPSYINHIIVLRLSNEEIIDLTEFILSRGFLLNQFINLQILSLYSIHSIDVLIRITYQCLDLPYLTHLNINKCNIEHKSKCIYDLFINIWNMKELTHCNLNDIHLKLKTLCEISITSTSIKHLFIENIPSDLNCLYNLFKYTPYIEELSITVYSYLDNIDLIYHFPTITSLKISFQGSINSMKAIFLIMSNLHRLIIDTLDIYLDGYGWEDIINDYLPKLKIFQLKMKFDVGEIDNNVEQGVNQLLATFQTPFWIEEHQWYVQCHWESSEISTCIILYTLPFAFNTIHYLNDCQIKSTYINQEEYLSCKNVQTFENNSQRRFIFHNFNLVCTQYPNISSLDIVLPFYDYLYTHNITLNNLTSLSITILTPSVYYQLQKLFDGAPRLHSIRIIFVQKLSIELFQLKHKSIRQIDFLGKQLNFWNQFTKDNCIAFTNSLLGRQCEVLSIEIEDRFSIIDLIQRMPYLRVLNVRYKNDKWDSNKRSSVEYEFIYWLQKQIPSTYRISINPEKSYCIQIWINQREKLSKRRNSLTKYKYTVSHFFTSVNRFFSKK